MFLLCSWLTLGLACETRRPPASQETRVPAPPASAREPEGALTPVASAPAARIELVAQHPLGVPLHATPDSSNVSARLPDAAMVTVLERRSQGRWLRVLSDSGLEGWVTERYTLEEHGARPPAPVSAIADPVWASSEACRQRVRGDSGQAKSGQARSGQARLMSFNVRWFPDGAPGKRPGKRPTDVAWLACAIAGSDVDVVLLQEIKTTAAAQLKLAELVQKLNAYTGGQFRAAFDDCPNPSSQHVGLVYDTKRVTASELRTYAALNPHGEPCKDQLRPGFGGFFKFAGGLDLHLLSVHLKSGHQRRDHELRLRSMEGLGAVVAQAIGARGDDDVIVGGDFNTMGCRRCSVPVTGVEELSLLEARLGSGQSVLTAVAPPLACSEYYRGEGTLLDHFLVSPGIARAQPGASVAGYCAELGCRAFDHLNPPAAYQRLSDHCPVILELPDTDDD